MYRAHCAISTLQGVYTERYHLPTPPTMQLLSVAVVAALIARGSSSGEVNAGQGNTDIATPWYAQLMPP